MTITQTIDIPESRQITLSRDVPTGRANVIIQFPVPKKSQPENSSWLPDPLPGGNYSTVEEALEAAERDAKDPNRKPISELFGTLPNISFGDPVAYQRAIRDEWDD